MSVWLCYVIIKRGMFIVWVGQSDNLRGFIRPAGFSLLYLNCWAFNAHKDIIVEFLQIKYWELILYSWYSTTWELQRMRQTVTRKR